MRSRGPNPEPRRPRRNPRATQSAAGFLERLRRGAGARRNAGHRALSRERRMARPHPPGSHRGGRRQCRRPQESPAESEWNHAGACRTNDLRHYLNQRLAASAADAATTRRATAARPRNGSRRRKIGPGAEIARCRHQSHRRSVPGGAPRALLVAGATAKLDATADAIAIARALVDRREQVVLVDLTRGPPSISGALGLPRRPGSSTGRLGVPASRMWSRSTRHVASGDLGRQSRSSSSPADDNERFGSRLRGAHPGL